MSEQKKKAADGEQLPKSDDSRILLKHLIDEVLEDIKPDGSLFQIITEMVLFGNSEGYITPEFKPYIDEELKKPEYNGKTLQDLARDSPKDYVKAMFQARDIAREAEIEELQEYIEQVLYSDDSAWLTLEEAEEKGELDVLLFAARKLEYADTHIVYKQGNDLYFVITKLIDIFFKPPQLPVQDGKYKMEYNKKGEEKIYLYFNILYNNNVLKEIGLQPCLDCKDLLILIFLYRQFVLGNRSITLTKLYRDMTGDDPNTRQKAEFEKRLKRLASTIIDLDATEVCKAWNLETVRKDFFYLADITISTKSFTVNGKIADAKIEIKDAPIIIQLGYELGQYTTITPSLLQVRKKKRGSSKERRMSMTPRQTKILCYLIRRIAPMRNGAVISHKITYDDLFEKTGELNTTAARRSAIQDTHEILSHFVKREWIKSWREDDPAAEGKTGKLGVKIYLQPTDKEKEKEKKGKKKGEKV